MWLGVWRNSSSSRPNPVLPDAAARASSSQSLSYKTKPPMGRVAKPTLPAGAPVWRGTPCEGRCCCKRVCRVCQLTRLTIAAACAPATAAPRQRCLPACSHEDTPAAARQRGQILALRGRALLPPALLPRCSGHELLLQGPDLGPQLRGVRVLVRPLLCVQLRVVLRQPPLAAPVPHLCVGVQQERQ